MEFEQPRAIYQQIADQMRVRILQGEFRNGERIPSIRELAVSLGVNPNTITKSYQTLTDRQIIENQRGLGYFVAAEAEARILGEMRQEFVREELPRVAERMRMLNMSLDEVVGHLSEVEREERT